MFEEIEELSEPETTWVSLIDLIQFICIIFPPNQKASVTYFLLCTGRKLNVHKTFRRRPRICSLDLPKSEVKQYKWREIELKY